MRLRPFAYHAPETLDEALALAGRHGEDLRLVAGGTALLLMIRYGIVRPAHVATLHRLDELKGIALDADTLRIGALTPHAEIAASPLVQEHCPVLALAAGRVATVAIRNMGTIGGNLCYAESASDPAPALLALDAVAVLRGPGGRRTLPLAGGFYRGLYETAMEEGEVLVAVEVPRQPRPGAGTYVKWSPRSREDKALVGVAAVLRAEGGVCRELRLAVGGVNPTPVRLRAAAAAAGQRLDDETVRAVARDAARETAPVADVQGSAEYRREMVEVWVVRALRDIGTQIGRAAR
jgi:aerobic carbon-monoxide dehydrogenase medium subunit